MSRGAIALPNGRLTAAAASQAMPHTAPMRTDALAIPAWDEDALTLACKAGRLLGDLSDVRHVVLALGEPVDTPRIVLAHLGLDDLDCTVLTGPDAGTHAIAHADDDTLVLAGTAPRPRPGADDQWVAGAGGAAVLGAAEPADVPRDLYMLAGMPHAIAPVVGAATAAKTQVPVTPPWLDLYHADVAARRHALDVVPPWQEGAQGAHVSATEWDAAGPARYRLHVGREGDHVHYPPTGRDGETRDDLPMEGTVAAVTTISPAGAPGEFAAQARAVGPYQVVIVEHEAGFRVIGQKAPDTPRVKAGDGVKAELRVLFRQMGSVRYALKWRAV